MPPSVIFPRRASTPASRVPPDQLAWASRNVERIRTATSSGRLRFARWPDWHTDETPEIRRSYRKMLREPTLKAAIGTKVLAVAALDAQAQPEDPDDPRHREQAEFLLWCLRRVGGRQAGANTYNLVGTRKVAWNVLAPGLIDGWSLNEMVWARDPVMRGRWAGKRCLADFKSKDTELLAPMVDEFQNVLGVRAAYNSGHVLKGEELEDCVLWANWALYEQPGGSSDFRAVYRAWWMKDTIWQLRGLHLEKYTGPYLKGTYADETLRPALAQELANARAQTWITVPEGTLIEAIDLSTRGTADFEAAIRDLDREMLVGTVGAYLHILEGQVSDGRGDTKVARETSELFQWLLAAVAGDVVTHQVAPRLLALNYTNPGEHVVTWGAVSEQAMQQRAAVDQALQEIGLKLSAKETYAYYGRQPPADPADVLVPPPKQGGGGEGGAPGGPPPPPGGGGGGDALPFGEARSHCMEGPNAGKPGPCPEGGGVEPPQGPTARHLDELESLHEEMEEGNAQEVAGRAVKALAGAEAGIRQRADDAPEEFVAHMSDQLEEHVEDVAPQAVKDYRQAVGALAEDLAYTVREAHDALDELAVAMDEGADGDEVYELSSRFQEYLATAREAAAEYPRRQAAAWAEAERSAWEEAREADPERYCQAGPNAGKPGPCPTAQDHAREARKALTRSDRHAGTVKWHLPAGHPDAEALRESRANADAGSLPAATRAKEATRYAATLRAVGARLKAEGKTTAARAAEKAAAHADEAAAALGRAHETRQAERGAKAQAVKAADAAGERALDHAASLPGEHPLRPALARVEALALEAHDPHEQDLAVRRKAMEGLRGEAARASSRLATMDTSGMDEDALASHGAALASLRGVAREAGAAAKHLASVTPRTHAEPDPDEEDDVRARAEAIAEILAGLFGEDALRLLEEVDDPGEDGVEKFSWNDIDHPRGTGGRFIQKGSAEAVNTARARVKEILGGKRTPDSLRQLTEHLSILTVAQLHEMKRGYGLKASGKAKAALAARIAEKLGGAAETAARAGLQAPAPAARPWEAGGGEPEKAKVYNAPTEALHVDPGRFQFKLDVDPVHGVTEELRNVKTFNPDFAGVVSVWKDPADGRTYVVNGHHRHELALRTGHPELAVRYVQAGSAKEARAVGALVNIAEGRGTAVDAAKFMRDMGVEPHELAGHGVSLSGRVAGDAVALTALNDRAFDRVTRGTLDPGKALAVAKHLKDHGRQDELFRLLDKREDAGKDLSPRVIEEMAREMASTPTATKTENTLFGPIDSEESLFVERNELKAHVRSELSREVKDFLAVSSKRRAEKVGKAGNVLDPETNRRIAQDAGRSLNTYDTLVNRKGDISDALNEAAAEYAQAKTRGARDAVRKKAVERVRDAVLGELEPRGKGTGVPGGAAASRAQPGG